MTRKEVIKEACEIVGLAYNSIRDYSTASDCFCRDDIDDDYYRNDGAAISYVRQAVIKALQEDGYKIPEVYVSIVAKKGIPE